MLTWTKTETGYEATTAGGRKYTVTRTPSKTFTLAVDGDYHPCKPNTLKNIKEYSEEYEAKNPSVPPVASPELSESDRDAIGGTGLRVIPKEEDETSVRVGPTIPAGHTEDREVALKVESCSWCPDPANPSAEHHPGMQVEHVPEPEDTLPNQQVFPEPKEDQPSELPGLDRPPVPDPLPPLPEPASPPVPNPLPPLPPPGGSGRLKASFRAGPIPAFMRAGIPASQSGRPITSWLRPVA